MSGCDTGPEQKPRPIFLAALVVCFCFAQNFVALVVFAPIFDLKKLVVDNLVVENKVLPPSCCKPAQGSRDLGIVGAIGCGG